MSDSTPDKVFAHDTGGGSILMRCAVCHTSRYVSDFLVTVRKEPQRCPICTGVPSYLEPVPRDEGETPANRLRSAGRRDRNSRANEDDLR